ncbi:MAG: hypothetical protein HIU85_04500 [Proteobacteria bacterium]|nr:hypothetical protein [Pseudomonadota bacterium]
MDALRALGNVEVRRLEEAGSIRDLDLILDLTSRAANPAHIPGPRFGYWTFLYGETPQRIAPGLAEILTGGRAAFVRLARLIPGGRAVILREGSVKTVTCSPSQTRTRLLEAASRWPAQKLAELVGQGSPPAGTSEVQLPVRSRAAQLGLRARLPLALLRNAGRRVKQELTRERWRIGVIEQPIWRLLENFDPAAIRWLDVPFDGFLADPFGLAGPDGNLVILAEAFPWRERRGRIAAIERHSDGRLAVTPTSLTFDTHLSYPQILEHNGEIYCIPESSAQGRVQLFRAVEFPHRWVPDSVLLEGFAGADATVIRYRDRWWMFTGNHAEQDEAKLFVFHSAELRGPWTRHAQNPVKCDLRSSRPGGTPFVGPDGALYRPAQDGSRVYGGAVTINRVIRLTPDEFEEEVAARLHPDLAGPCPDGMHTLSAVGDLTLVDGKRHELLPAPLAAALDRLRALARSVSGHRQNRLRQTAS